MIELLIDNYPDIILHTARIFSSVFEIMLAFLLINNFFKPKDKFIKRDYLPFFILAATVIFLQEYFDVGSSRYIVECIALTVILFGMYKGKISNKIKACVAFFALVGISIVLSNVLYSFISSRINIDTADTSPFAMLLKFTLSNILMIPLAVLMSVVLKGHSGGSSTFRMWISLLLVPSVTLITFSVFQYIIETYSPNRQITVYIYISCIGLIIINAAVFILFGFNQRQTEIKTENELLTTQLSLQQSSIKNLENAYNRTRQFRHDIKNHILTMNILAENGDLAEIKKYLKEMSGIIDESSYVRITGVSAVDAILNEKLYEAQFHSITTNYDVTNFQKNGIKPVDMCIILSNALDNAIEANDKVENPADRYIKLKMYGDESYTVISVANPTNVNPVKIADNSFKTSKDDKNNHGLGLKSIETTSKKYGGEMLAKCTDGVFTLVVRLNASSI